LFYIFIADKQPPTAAARILFRPADDGRVIRASLFVRAAAPLPIVMYRR
jgi:hypothetical protein